VGGRSVVSIPDRVLGFFRPSFNLAGENLEEYVSIPDRVLGLLGWACIKKSK